VQAANASIIPVYGAGQNWAPLKPFEQVRDKAPAEHYLCDAIRERFGHFLKADEAPRNEMLEMGRIVDEFISGKQIFGVNPYTGQIKALPVRRHDSSTQRAITLMQYFVTKIEEKILLSNPDIQVFPGVDSEKAQSAAYAATAIVDHFEEKFFDGHFNRVEANLILRWGTLISRVRHDPGIKGVTAQRTVFGEIPATFGEGAGYCSECKYKGVAAEFTQQGEAEDGEMVSHQACPGCGSEWVLVEQPPQRNVIGPTGTETVEMGDLRLETLPLPACWWNLAKRPEDSERFIYRQRIPRGELVRLLGHVSFPQSSSRDSDKGLDVLEGLARQGVPLGGTSKVPRNPKSSLYQEQDTLDEFWMSPCDYADIVLKGDERTIGGVDLPTGTRLLDVFPDGLVAVGINGMSLLLGLYAEKHADHISSSVWHMRPHSGAGRGIVDMVESQMRLNQADNQVRKALDTTTPGGFYDASLVSGEEVSLAYRPGTFVPVDLTKYPGDQRNLSNAIFPVPPTTIPSAVAQYGSTTIKEIMTLQSHVVDNTTGVFQIDPKTATGQQLLQRAGNSIFTPMLLSKAGMRKGIAERSVKLYVKHTPLSRWIPLRNRIGGRQGLMLKGADLDYDLVFTVVRDSEAPNNTFTKRQDSDAFLERTGGVQGYFQLKQAYPAQMATFEQRYGIDIESGTDSNVVEMRCSQRLEQAAVAVQAGALDPAEILAHGFINPLPSVAEPKHIEMATWYSEWMLTDAGWNAPPPLRLFAEAMAAMHLELNAQKQGRIMLAQTQAAMMGGMMMPGEEEKPAPKEKRPPERKAA
jgi:hypothetical protein